MFTISKLNSNLVASICAFVTSALFIGLSVGPAETASIGALLI